eukprot:TRINITY_DN10091_c0_g1_i1.p1 TRINITY_DN10091_c0_g1~~TRINITY_DN10091_c0_g1_i1.p1  ORF type:complete len:349 (-),score=108.33 TRINITY_DN10091_c0_g1_i1:97-1116(-)
MNKAEEEKKEKVQTLLSLFDSLDEELCNHLYQKHDGDFDGMVESALTMMSAKKEFKEHSMEKILESLNELDQKLSNLESQFSSDRNTKFTPPKAIIFDSSTDDLQSRNEAIQILQQKGFKQQEIFHSCLPDRDLEVDGYLKTLQKSTPSSSLPRGLTICIGNKVVCNLDELKQLGDEKIKVIFTPSETESPEPQEEVRLGMVEQLIDVGISMVQYSVGTVWSYLGYFGLVTANEGKVDSDKEPFEDFPVLHTNWYWRRLERVFRFKPKSFLRVHPSTGQIRAVKDYTEVEKIQLVDKNSLIIFYKDGSSPDFVVTSFANLKKMVRIFIQRSSPPPKIIL